MDSAMWPFGSQYARIAEKVGLLYLSNTHTTYLRAMVRPPRACLRISYDPRVLSATLLSCFLEGQPLFVLLFVKFLHDP